jgi:hypothetical protein
MKKKFECPDCNEKRCYDETWDAYYCEKCDKWLEEPCNSKPEDGAMGCWYRCWERPQKPSQAKSDVKMNKEDNQLYDAVE